MSKRNPTNRFENLGNYLREAREKQNLKQIDVAKKIGYDSSQFISNIERGISSLPLKKLKILINVLKLNENELIAVLSSEREREFVADLQMIKKTLGSKGK